MDNLWDYIIKYKKGELSPEQMHALEKRALADPFLAEALEGIETISTDELVTDISAIEKRVFQKKNPAHAGLFTPLRIAAGVLLVVSSVFIVYQFIPKAESIALKTEKPNPENKKEEGQKVKSEKLKVESGAEKIIVENQKPKAEIEETKKVEPIASSSPSPIAKTHQPKSDNQGAGNETQSAVLKAPVQGLAAIEEQSAKTETEDDKVSKEIVTAEPKAAGVNEISRARKKDFAASEAQRSAVPPTKSRDLQSISGQVVTAEDSSPLPGVSVTVKGTSIGTVTDLKGNYTISTEGENRPLVFSFIGLQQQEVDASGKNKIDVTMKDDATQLSEVVVTGLGLAKDEDHEPVITLAEPIGGKKAYDTYLESHLKYPDEALKNKIKGKAGIEFKVSLDGSLKDFRVIKKLGYGCEEEIIRLVKEGPKWVPSTEDNKPTESTVRVRLRFDPAKSGNQKPDR